MALLTDKTPEPTRERVLRDFRGAYAPMARQTTPKIFTVAAIERVLLPRLPSPCSSST